MQEYSKANLSYCHIGKYKKTLTAMYQKKAHMAFTCSWYVNKSL